MVPILRLGLKNKGTEKEPRAPVPRASPLLGLKLPKNEKQRKDTVEGRGQHLREVTRAVSVGRVNVPGVERGAALPRANTADTASSGPRLTWKAFSPLRDTPASCKDTGSLTWDPGTSEVTEVLEHTGTSEEQA